METTLIKSPPRTMMELFESLPEGTLVQLIENNIVMSPSPIVRHQKISNAINVKLYNFVEQNQLGEVFVAPLDVYLDEQNAYQPDIIFISNGNMEIVHDDGFVHGAPDLVIELLSPSTAKYDLNEKKGVYERSGVTEYWIVDPENKETQGYFLEDGTYIQIFAGKGLILSRLLDYEIKF